VQAHPKIVADEIITLKDATKSAPEVMRRVVAWVEVEVERAEREMVFLTNQLLWSPHRRGSVSLPLGDRSLFGLRGDNSGDVVPHLVVGLGPWMQVGSMR